MVNILVNELVEKIKPFVLETIRDQEDLFLVDIINKSKIGGGKMIVLLDGDNGVSIEKCVQVSRAVSRFIDEELELKDPLTLEVSSAGLDHPLTIKRQYFKNVGKSLRVTLNDQSESIGKLKLVEEDSIILDVPVGKKKQTEEVKIDFDNIKKTIVLVSFK
ncbi:MAG: ribosome maturation factor RimP [Reichenbachiella sp.]